MIQEATVGRISSAELQTELFRKSIHFLIALVPPLASIHLAATMALLGAGTMVYAVAELLRLQGRTVVFISGVTRRAARDRDQGRFVLGPITLGLGAMLALLLYPEPAAVVAIYALAFGDGLASLVGKLFPFGRMMFLGGKPFRVVSLVSSGCFSPPLPLPAVVKWHSIWRSFPLSLKPCL